MSLTSRCRTPDETAELLAGGTVARLATINENSYPHVTSVILYAWLPDASWSCPL
jgi:nitroimidazol reductase NimA-like FMN-containing flavoprotein (pyridoxamine 5'-phosphate oxidase superfamily)